MAGEKRNQEKTLGVWVRPPNSKPSWAPKDTGTGEREKGQGRELLGSGSKIKRGRSTKENLRSYVSSEAVNASLGGKLGFWFKVKPIY